MEPSQQWQADSVTSDTPPPPRRSGTCRTSINSRLLILTLMGAVFVTATQGHGQGQQDDDAAAQTQTLMDDGWQLVAHESQRRRRRPNDHQAQEAQAQASTLPLALLPSTYYGRNKYNYCSYSSQQQDSNSHSPSYSLSSLPSGRDGSFQRPFPQVAQDMMFQSGDGRFTAVLDYDSFYTQLQMMTAAQRLEKDQNRNVNATSTVPSLASSSASVSSSSSLFMLVSMDGSLFRTQAFVHKLEAANDNNNQYVVLVDGRGTRGLDQLFVLWGDLRDIDEEILGLYLDDVNEERGDEAEADEDDDVDDDDDDGRDHWDLISRLVGVAETYGGLNVFIRGGTTDTETELSIHYRTPLRESGWTLLSHAANTGDYFSGNGKLRLNYSYSDNANADANAGYGSSSWYNVMPWTPDFAIPVSTSLLRRVNDLEIMFVSGDASLWAIADFMDLRTAIDDDEDAQDGTGAAVAANTIDFHVSAPDFQGYVKRVQGNVLSKKRRRDSNSTSNKRNSKQHDDGDDLLRISVQGSLMQGIKHQRIVWGEGDYYFNDPQQNNRGSSNHNHNKDYSLKNDHGGINVYVRDKSQFGRDGESSSPRDFPCWSSSSSSSTTSDSHKDTNTDTNTDTDTNDKTSEDKDRDVDVDAMNPLTDAPTATHKRPAWFNPTPMSDEDYYGDDDADEESPPPSPSPSTPPIASDIDTGSVIGDDNMTSFLPSLHPADPESGRGGGSTILDVNVNANAPSSNNHGSQDNQITSIAATTVSCIVLFISFCVCFIMIPNSTGCCGCGGLFRHTPHNRNSCFFDSRRQWQRLQS
jgi:hypothetical protein